MSSSPLEVRQNILENERLIRVKGEFHPDGEVAPAEYGKPFLIKGTIQTERGKLHKVWLHYMEAWVNCGVQFTPPVAAEGTFWISRRKTDGYREMRLWEGEYLPSQQKPVSLPKPIIPKEVCTEPKSKEDADACTFLQMLGVEELRTAESVAVGTGEQMKLVRTQARKCGLANRIDYVGTVIATFDVFNADITGKNCLMSWVWATGHGHEYSDEKLDELLRTRHKSKAD
ncbi:MAG: hypothetical protein ABJP34_10825 [Erythrobacter sp.]